MPTKPDVHKCCTKGKKDCPEVGHSVWASYVHSLQQISTAMRQAYNLFLARINHPFVAPVSLATDEALTVGPLAKAKVRWAQSHRNWFIQRLRRSTWQNPQQNTSISTQAHYVFFNFSLSWLWGFTYLMLSYRHTGTGRTSRINTVHLLPHLSICVFLTLLSLIHL